MKTINQITNFAVTVINDGVKTTYVIKERTVLQACQEAISNVWGNIITNIQPII